MRSTLLPGQQWDVMVDLFFYREPEETKEPGEEDAAEYGQEGQYGQLPAPGGTVLQSMDVLITFTVSIRKCDSFACKPWMYR